MEIHCHITGICEAPMSSSLFSVICSWFSKVLLFLFVTKINSPNLNATWLIYLRSTYKNRLEYPFKWIKWEITHHNIEVKIRGSAFNFHLCQVCTQNNMAKINIIQIAIIRHDAQFAEFIQCTLAWCLQSKHFVISIILLLYDLKPMDSFGTWRKWFLFFFFFFFNAELYRVVWTINALLTVPFSGNNQNINFFGVPQNTLP